MRRRRAARLSRGPGLLTAAALCDRGVALRQEFETSGRLNLLDEAVRLGKDAVRATPRDHSDRALHTRFEATSRRQDIDETVWLARAAVAMSAPGDDLCLYLSNLGNALRARFEVTGRGRRPRGRRRGRSASRGRQPPRRPSSRDVPVQPCPGPPGAVRAVGSTDDLDAAVALGTCAVDGTAADDTGLAMRRSTLGGALRQRFERFGRVEDLEEADRLGRDALSAAIRTIPTAPSICPTTP